MKFLNKTMFLRLGFVILVFFNVANITFLLFGYKIVEEFNISSSEGLFSTISILIAFIVNIIAVYFIFYCFFHLWKKSNLHIFYKILYSILFGLGIPMLIYYIIAVEKKFYRQNT
ncbi:MAG: hypothetical protein KAQ94_05900 [Arcobacteraceae bacterium]|nr:hypothetical protein [Arcobacteraceae bacterium]